MSRCQRLTQRLSWYTAFVVMVIAWSAVGGVAGDDTLPAIEQRLREMGLSTMEPTSRPQGYREALRIPATTGVHDRPLKTLSPENKHIMALYVRAKKHRVQNDPDPLGATTTRAFPANVSTIADGQKTKLTFDLSRLSGNETVKKVELRLNPLDHHGRGRPIQTLRFRLSLKDKVMGCKRARIFSANIQLPVSDGSLVADLSSYLAVMEDTVGKINRDMEIELVYRSMKRGEEDTRIGGGQGFFLVIYSNSLELNAALSQQLESAGRRRKRSAGALERELESVGKRTKRAAAPNQFFPAPPPICQGVKYTVDLEQIGWYPFVIHPKQYEDEYCTGTCRVQSNLNLAVRSSLHALVQSLMTVRNAAVPEPCCVPVSYQQQQFLMLDIDGHLQIEQKNVVADKCGCR